MAKTKKSNCESRKQRTNNLAGIVAKYGLGTVASKINSTLGLTVDGAKSAIARTIKGINSEYNAAKVLNAAEGIEQIYRVETTATAKSDKPTNAKKAVKARPAQVQAETQRKGYNTGGTLLMNLSSTQREALTKQAEFVQSAMDKINTSVWRLAGEVYRDMGLETQKQASSRIYRALEMSGYAENVIPVLEYLMKHFSHVMLNKKANKETVKAAKEAPRAEKDTTVRSCQDPHCVMKMLEDLNKSVKDGRWNFVDMIASLPSDFCKNAGISPLLATSAVETMITQPKTVLQVLQNVNEQWLAKAVLRLWQAIPAKNNAVESQIEMVKNGLRQLFSIVEQMTTSAK